MSTSEEKPINTGELQEIRDESGRFKPGMSGNPKGKPVGAKNKFSFVKYWQERWDNNPKEFEDLAVEFMKDDKLRGLILQMVDGRPHQTTDITSDNKPIPLLYALPDNNSDKKDSETKEENQSDTGRDISG